MIERFQGESGRQNLIEALRAQKIVAGATGLAEQIANLGSIIERSPGTSIIEQGGEDNDIYLIIAGAFDILVNGRKVARRFGNDHVGEMAAIQPTQRRSATVTATEKSVLCKLTEPQLSKLARQYPDIWRFVGVRGANDLVWVGRAANYAAKLATLPEAYGTYITAQVHDNMNAEVKTWTDGQQMWEAARWANFDNSIIYRSGWWWNVDYVR